MIDETRLWVRCGLAVALLLALLAWAGLAHSQQAQAPNPVTTWPVGTTSTNASGTVTAGGVYQSVFAATQLRKGCTIQNNGSHTMYVFFGPIASATHATSVQLLAGQWVKCQAGPIILQDQVSLDGTTADAFFAAQQ